MSDILNPIKLVAPVTGEGLSVKSAILKRHTAREFSPQPLSLKHLSEILWAAYGINRKPSGGRTCPSAMHVYALEVFAITAEGAFLYDPEEHKLNPVAAGDLRPLAGEQDFVATAPLDIAVFVDRDKMKKADLAFADLTEPQIMATASLDAGAATENVYLYCASENINVVERLWVAGDTLRDALGLDANHSFVIAMTLGYPPAK